MRILIIKLGALGDVIRTLPLAKALKREFKGCEINWVTKENAASIVKRCKYVDKVYALPYNEKINYDRLYNFDIDKDATTLATEINASVKKGFYSDNNYPLAFDMGGEYYLNTLFDDEIKKNNKKTYQEMMFESAGLKYNKESIDINLTKEDINYSSDFVKKNNLKLGKIIGIHIGSSPRWPSKSWHESKIIEFVTKVKQEGYDVLLFAGPDDVEKQKNIINSLNNKKIPISKNDPDNSLTEFYSLMNICNYIVCSDSLALHLALALKKKTIALFFCTSYNEIEGYGFLNKIVSPLLEKFFPERMNEYNEELTKSIKPEQVLEAIKRFGEKND